MKTLTYLAISLIMSGCASHLQNQAPTPVYTGVTAQTTALRQQLEGIQTDSKEVKRQQTRAIYLIDKLEDQITELLK